MKLAENLLDMADAEYFAGSLSLIQAGYQGERDADTLKQLMQKHPTVVSWFQSLDQEGQKRVVSYLQNRHGCYSRFGF